MLKERGAVKWGLLNTVRWNGYRSNSEPAHADALAKERKELGSAAFKRTPGSRFCAKPLPIKAPRLDVDWKSVDWSQPNIRLSESIGCTRELIRQKRAKLGKPKSSVYERKFRGFLAFLKGRDRATPRDFARFGISYMTGRRYLRRAQKLYEPTPRNEWRRKVSPRLLMNWELPNVLLDAIWGVRKGTCATYRSRMGMQRAAFRAGARNVAERLAGMVEAERKKAKQWNNNHLLRSR